MKILRSILLLVILVLPRSSLDFNTPGNQYLSWSADGNSFTTFGPNQAITIYDGKMDFVNPCPPPPIILAGHPLAGFKDELFPFTDIYIVKSGLRFFNGALSLKIHDQGSAANTVQGTSEGLFIDEIVGVTGPSGKLRAGEYAVVYDECQDGIYDASVDALFDPAFKVIIPQGDVPPLPASITKLKEDAGYRAIGFLVTYAYLWVLFDFHTTDNHLSIINTFLQNLKLSHVFFEILEEVVGKLTSVDPKEVALRHTLNTFRHYQSLAADPPDPDFMQTAPLSERQVVVPDSDDLVYIAAIQLGNENGNEAALSEALLISLERYQGAEAVNDGEWALIHARAIKAYANLLAQQLGVSNLAEGTLSDTFGDDIRPFDIDVAKMEEIRARIVAEGFSAEEIREARNLEISDAELENMRSDMENNSYAYTKSSIQAELSSLQANSTTLATSLAALSSDMDPIIATLEADYGVPDDMPQVNAGGPYNGIEGSPITFDGSSSISPSPITLYEWDLDADGSFDDGTGTTASLTYQNIFSGLIGLRVTTSAGYSNIGYALVHISEINSPPTILDLSPTSQAMPLEVGNSQSFSVDVNDPDGDAVSIEWLIDGTTNDTGNIFTFTAHTSQVGIRVISARVTDNEILGGAIRQDWFVFVLMPDGDMDGWRSNTDCNDSDSAIHPGQEEIHLNGKDDDCNPDTMDSAGGPIAFFHPQSSGRNVALLEAGATVHSFSSQFTGAQAPQNMLNYTISDEPWSTGNGLTTNQWVIFLLDDGITYLIDRIQLMPRTDFGTQRVKDFAIDVSTTTTQDAAFTTVLTGTAVDNGQLQEFLLPSPVFAKYIRYRALNNRGSSCCISTEQLRVITRQAGGPNVTFQNLSSDADNDIVSYLWDFGDGNTSVETSPTHSYSGPGTYLVSLTAIDSTGQENTFSLNQQVVIPPTAGFTNNPSVPNEGQSVIFNDTSSIQAGRPIIERNWSWGDGSTATTTAASSTSHTFRDNQSYQVTLKVADSFGLENTITKTIIPNNVPPTANGGVDRKWISGLPLEFRVNITDPGVSDVPFICHWDFGDGGSAETCTASHTYTLPSASAGQSFTATVTVTDKDGGVGNDSLVVKIGAACTPGALGTSSDTASGELYYTRFTGLPNVKKVGFDYDGTVFTLNTPATVASVIGADGIVFSPSGDILIGGQGNRLHKIDPITGTVVTVNPGMSAYHLALDTSGTKVWASGIPGNLASVPLDPFANGTVHTLAGDDTAITSIAFDKCGNAFYTSSGASGNGNFGVIDLTSFTTTRRLTNLPAAHGMAYDEFSGHLLLFGSTHVTQINPASLEAVSDLIITGATFDQGTADGKGHVYVASNTGHIIFVDYSSTGLVDATSNYKSYVFLDTNLDDVAPLSGPGAPPNDAPILPVIADQLMSAGETLDVQVSASDPDNDILTLTTGQLPAFASFVDNGNGNGKLTFQPMNSDVGSYEITVNVNDGEETDSSSFILTVNATTAQLIVIKHVINDNGGTADASDFIIQVSATNPSLNLFTGDESGTSITLDAGSYNVTETGSSGYTESYSEDCSGTIAGGETKTCIISNDDQAPKLHLRKVIVNDNGGTAVATAWTLNADGTGANDVSGTIPVDSGTSLKADTFALSEWGGPSGYTESDWICVGGTQSGSNITLGIGEEATCTITNDDIAPKLHLRKIVVNDNGATKTVADFTLAANGADSNDLSGTSPVDSGAGLKADTWALSETNLNGYLASAWVCVGGAQLGSSITLGVGEEATCTITNDDKPGQITIIKNVKPAQGSFVFTTTGTGYNGFILTGATTNNGNKNTQTLNAGNYTVKESTQLAWILTGIGGSPDPSTPFACTVIGSGGSTGVGDLSTQTATINLKNGDTVTCMFENTGEGATRTQGFWATHPQLAQIAWFGGTAFGHTFPGVASIDGIGDKTICGRAIEGPGTNDISKLMGSFWSDISKTSIGAKRSSLDQARMQLLQQLIAAELNASAFGSVPSGGSGMFAQWESALCGTNQNMIKTAQQQAAAFNTQGDSSTFTPGTSADSKYARSVADIPFWDKIKP